MRVDRGERLLVWIAFGAGVIVDTARINAVKAGRPWSDPSDLFVLAWNIAPFAVLLALPYLTRSRSETVGGVVALVVPALGSGIHELLSYVDPLGLLFAPVSFLCFIGVGVYTVRLCSWLRRRTHGHTPGA